MNSNQPKYNASLDEAADAIAADNRELLQSSIASLDSDNGVNAWIVKAWASDSIRESELAIQQALETEPNNETAVAGLNWINGIKGFAFGQREAKRAEEARIQAEEKARIQAEEEARIQAEEEARREAELEIERHAEFERHAELERQAELVRQAELARENQVKEQRLVELAPSALLPLAGNTGEVQAESDLKDSIETEIKDEVTALVVEVQQETQIQDDNGAEPIAESARPAKNQVVLAVDDSPTVRKLVSLTLSREGFEVVTAKDGLEALNILAERLPDIILTDINMPKLNGYKLCNFVKKHVRTKDVPVVMLSGKDGVFDKMRGKMNGCTDFIAKPFESADLISKVREILSGTSAG